MSVRRLLAATAAALIVSIGLAAPAAHAAVQPAAAGFYDFSLGRLGATTGALAGLAGVVIGGLTLARPAGRPGAANRSLVAIAAGLVAMALGGLVAATADHGIGTGNGRGGAYVALLVGLIAAAVGGRALARTRAASA
ncbi:DUF6223 family protein [Streptomyces sp. NPDC058662]|uniref:DUF6223 family protein n=1 Tax=Streptomyces sp. NPDC058662 TaxID=3346583 RepID=UPI00364C6D13